MADGNRNSDLLAGTSGRRQHVLTIVLEDYYHGPAFTSRIDPKHWGRLETRAEETCVTLLECLRAAGAKATFFVSAWTARNLPGLTQIVSAEGHEIALAGQRGRSFRKLSPALFREEVVRDRDVVEQASGKRMLGFRVTDVLLRASDLWALDVLAKEGFLYDSSLSPFLYRFGRDARRCSVHQNGAEGNPFWEFPLTSYSLAGLRIPIAGGNYFRQFPEVFVSHALRSMSRQDAGPLVLYYRLWDFDPSPPRLHTGSMLGQVRHYRNRHKVLRIVDTLFKQYQFTDIAGYLGVTQPDREVTPLQPGSANAPPVFYKGSVKGGKVSVPVSVVIPCFNEQSGIVYLDNTLRELAANARGEFDLQFVIVDDGSSDNTWNLLQQTFGSRPSFILLRHEVNRGVTAAILTGLRHSREIVCSMDCDCTYDPNELIPMLRLLTDGVDLVTASPYHPLGGVRNVPNWRLAMSRGASALYRLATGSSLSTFTSCFRVYRRSAVAGLNLRYDRFLGVAELLTSLLLSGRTILEYPAVLDSRMLGQSKMRVVRTTAGHLRLLVSLFKARLVSRPRGPHTPVVQESHASAGVAGGDLNPGMDDVISQPRPAALTLSCSSGEIIQRSEIGHVGNSY